MGLNVSTRRSELPEGAVSLTTEGAECTDRDPLLRAILRTLADRYAEWSAGPDRLRPAYEAVCDTIGHEVRVQLPDGGAADRHRDRAGRGRPAGRPHYGR